MMTAVVNADTRGLGAWHIPRSRGAVTGLLLMLLGLWGALIPFVGPYFHFEFTQDGAWTWTSARFWLELLPGIATFVGGLLLAASANRGTAVLGAWLAVAAGAWYVVGPTLTGPWHLGNLGAPRGGTAQATLEWLSFFYGLGAVIIFLGSTAWGRLSVRGVRDVAAARRRRDARAADPDPRQDVPPAVSEPQVYPSDRPTAGQPWGATDVNGRAAGPPGAGDQQGYDQQGYGQQGYGQQAAPTERSGAFGRHRRRSHSTR